jgi:hypothetical protein
MKDIVDVSDPRYKPYHNAVAFNKPFETIGGAPVVEMTAIFLPTDIDKSAFEAAWGNAISDTSKIPEGFLGGCSGWAMDDVEGHPKMPKAKLFLVSTGWESMERATAAVEKSKDNFKELAKFSEVVETVSISIDLTPVYPWAMANTDGLISTTPPSRNISREIRTYKNETYSLAKTRG